MNFVNENEFISWIKEGGYGKVYKGINILILKQEILQLEIL